MGINAIRNNDKQVLTLGRIRDYIIKYFPDLLFWDGYSKHETFRSYKSYKHRQGMPNEIRIEFDSNDTCNNFKLVNDTCIKLYNNGYSFAVYYVEGGRSPHIHLYDIDDLELFNLQERESYRRMFLEYICPRGSKPDYGLCDEKHLCALEFVNHFKYNKPKELLHFFFNGSQKGVDFNILKRDDKKKEVVKDTGQKKLGEVIINNKRDLLIRAGSFEKIFDRFNIEYKNGMALCPFHADKDKSLSFSNDKGLWHCFGCKEKGDIISLYQKIKGVRSNGK